MADEFVYVNGLPELKTLLEQLPTKVARTVLRRSVAAGAQVVKKAVIAAAPVANRVVRRGSRSTAPGTLKSSVRIRFVRARSNDTQVDYTVGFGAQAFYAGFVEFGHKIVPRRGKGRPDRLSSRRKQATGEVPAHPFVGPAFESVKSAALAAIVDTLSSGIEKAFNE